MSIIHQFNPQVSEFKKELKNIKDDYRGLFNVSSSEKLEGEYRDEVQRDVGKLYMKAQAAIANDAYGEDAKAILSGLEDVDILLERADLTRDNVSHNHEWICDYLAECAQDTDLSFLYPGND